MYAVADQLVWKKPGTTDGGIGVFARVMVAPPDRNLVDGFVQGGIISSASFARRENDTVGLAMPSCSMPGRPLRSDLRLL